MKTKTKLFRRFCYFALLIFLNRFVCNAQISLLNSFSSFHTDEMSSLSCFGYSNIGISVENGFFLKELMKSNMNLSYKIKDNIIPISISHYGLNTFGVFSISSGYGINFGNKLSIMVRGYYLIEHAKNYDSRHSLCVDFGFTYSPLPKIYFNVLIYNPFMQRYGFIKEDRIPMKFDVSMLYMFSENMLTYFLVEKSLPGTFEIAGGFEYQAFKYLKLGVQCSNSNANFNLTIPVNNFLIKISTLWFYKLGISTKLSAYYFV